MQPIQDAYLHFWGFCKAELYMKTANIMQLKTFSRRLRELLAGKPGVRRGGNGRARGFFGVKWKAPTAAMEAAIEARDDKTPVGDAWKTGY
jgi:hypothetical protein